MKTEPMSQQVEALKASGQANYFAYLMEQGTGKTWTILAETEMLYAAGEIDALVVVAPNGVHSNWTKDEIPKHWGDTLPWVAVTWSSKAGKRERAANEKALFKPREVGNIPYLRVLTMNFEALLTSAGKSFLFRFLAATRAVLVVDESQKIRNPRSGRHQQLMKIRNLAEYRRCASGTPITKGPENAYGQFEFLHRGLLGTSNYRAFIAEYTELVDENHPLVKKILEQNTGLPYNQIPERIKNNRAPQIALRDPITNRPVYRNLEKLADIIAPHSFRKLKKDCLDIPEKIYQRRRFDLIPKQRRMYEAMNEEYKLIETVAGEGITTTKLVALNKLQQITRGFYKHADIDDGGVEQIMERKDNPALKVLMEEVDSTDGQIIIWGRLHEEINDIVWALDRAGESFAQYHGQIPDKRRAEEQAEFKAGKRRVMVANAQAGGLGLTWTVAETAIYYSNELDAEYRWQSEDRNHRIGTTKARYIDIIANDTRDETIAAGYVAKQEIAEIILRDHQQELRHE